jgi:hypothetical protein
VKAFIERMDTSRFHCKAVLKIGLKRLLLLAACRARHIGRRRSDPATLAVFVQRSLEAKAGDPAFARIDVQLGLVDCKGGYGGGLESDSSGGTISIDDIGGAIGNEGAEFRRAHPAGDDSIGDIVGSQCLIATLGLAEGYCTRRLKRPVCGINCRLP